MKSLLDPSFRYTRSEKTDLRKTFAKVRRELNGRRDEVNTSKGTPQETPHESIAVLDQARRDAEFCKPV